MSVLEEFSALGIDRARLHPQAPMHRYTTFRTGGPADLLIDLINIEEIPRILALAHALSLPVTVIGNGSNLLVADSGIRGVVLRTAAMNQAEVLEGGIYAQAGITLHALAVLAQERGLSGLVPLSGIPGTLGGALIMNAGAYGGEIGPLTKEVQVLTSNGEIKTLHRDELSFSYRRSALQTSGDMVLAAKLTLSPGDPAALLSQMQELARQRREKQPVELPSAGSTFKRPKDGYAAALIDQCGLKGCRIGDAMVSPKHAGFIVNCGSATTEDILSLMDFVRSQVQLRTGVILEPEVRILGL